MAESEIAGRIACGVLTLLGALLLAMGRGTENGAPRGRSRRGVAWGALLVLALGHAIWLTVQPGNLLNINLAHHYLGAKHRVGYGEFYSAVQAALLEPQAGMRDLEHPPRMVRATDEEERAYLLDLIRERGDTLRGGAKFIPFGPTAELRAAARASGALAREAEEILTRALPPGSIAPFRSDVVAVTGALQGRPLIDDYGYNGSPFYSAVRSIDPALRLTFGPLVGFLSLLWQIAAALLVVWLLGMALDYSVEERLQTAALLFAAWDFTGWTVPGLVFAGWWLPIGVAAWAASRGRWVLTGAALAWATAVKLFPALLLLPALVGLLGSAAARRASSRVLFGFVVGAGGAWVVSLASGRSWAEFGEKIVSQFQGTGYLLNSVSVNQLLMVLGLREEWAGAALGLWVAVFLPVVWLRTREPREQDWPRIFLVLLGVGGWVVHTWFNYYAIAPLFLLPFVGRTRPRFAALLCLLTALAALWPEFDDPRLLDRESLHVTKLLPYLAVPLALLWLELRVIQSGAIVRRGVWIGSALLFLIVGGRVVQERGLLALEREGNAALDRGEAVVAVDRFQRLLRRDPDRGSAAMNAGIAVAIAGNRRRQGDCSSAPSRCHRRVRRHCAIGRAGWRA
ncbi:MAG: hypothetical protein IPK72_25630 [Candidatus Eisenbacteria bacterium]|nr:hypothetical protein [Candidatus Eisenbacteria bacterium]